MYNGQNKYVPYMQQTKRSLNDHRPHLTSQVTDSIPFVSRVKNLVHIFMMRSKGKSTKTLLRGRGRKHRGLVEGTLILPYIRRLGPFLGVQIFNFNIFGVFQEDEYIYIYIYFLGRWGSGGGSGYNETVDI